MPRPNHPRHPQDMGRHCTSEYEEGPHRIGNFLIQESAGTRPQGSQDNPHDSNPTTSPGIPHKIPWQNERRHEYLHVFGPPPSSRNRNSASLTVVGHIVGLQHTDILRRQRRTDDETTNISHHRMGRHNQYYRAVARDDQHDLRPTIPPPHLPQDHCDH